MKRSVFVRNVLEQRATYEEWARMVMHDRVGEAPHHLLCEWRRAYDVPAHVPYGTCTVVSHDGGDGFHLECDDCVLMYGRLDASNRPRVTLYHATDGERKYKAWKRYRHEWPVRNAPIWWEALPKDVHKLIFRAARVASGSFCTTILSYGAPVCKGWVRFWATHVRYLLKGPASLRLVCRLAWCALRAFEEKDDSHVLRGHWAKRIFWFLNRKDKLPADETRIDFNCPIIMSTKLRVGWKWHDNIRVLGVWSLADSDNNVTRIAAFSPDELVACWARAQRDDALSVK